MELGHFDKHSPTTQERKAPQGKNPWFFPRLETLKIFILNDKFYLQMTTIRAFFLQIRSLFFNFQKKVGEIPPSPRPALVTRLNTFFKKHLKQPKNFEKSFYNKFYIIFDFLSLRVFISIQNIGRSIPLTIPTWKN